jgi:hypothetical protein
MKRIIPAPLPVTPDFDPLADYPEDIDRIIAAATNLGYQVTPRDAAELWRRHCGDVCANWFAVDGADHDIVMELLKHAEVQPDAADSPSPPEGYANWLDFAVDTMDTRAEEQERIFAGTPLSRQAMRDAVHSELVVLRRKANEI